MVENYTVGINDANTVLLPLYISNIRYLGIFT